MRGAPKSPAHPSAHLQEKLLVWAVPSSPETQRAEVAPPLGSLTPIAGPGGVLVLEPSCTTRTPGRSGRMVWPVGSRHPLGTTAAPAAPGRVELLSSEPWLPRAVGELRGSQGHPQGTDGELPAVGRECGPPRDQSLEPPGEVPKL